MDLLDEAREEGEERKRFYKKTEEVEGERRLKESTGMLPLSIQQWSASKELRVLDVEQYHAGVSSYPALRYLVLWDQGEEEESDDRLSQLRELSDPVVYNKRSFYSNVSRLSYAQEVLWASSHEVWGHEAWHAQGLEWKSFFLSVIYARLFT